MALNRAVTTCRLPLQTMKKGDIQQHLTNPDTMSTLVSDTLVMEGFMAQWQRPLVGVLPPRVQILGAAPLCSKGFPWSFSIKKHIFSVI